MSEVPEHEYEPPIVRDKRRIDPDTGAVRPDVTSGITDAVPGAASASGPTMTPPNGCGMVVKSRAVGGCSGMSHTSGRMACWWRRQTLGGIAR